ncbi:hypothetical protein HY256_00780, partial [Candidatus Sumerlaeota bacterium]|nr:hypothetical protein [Candidatus Sumerlaeota bacterium]
DEEKIPRGVGRGVTVASILAYCLGITRLDPIQYRLAYQPLAGERETFPSIRVEIPSNAAPKVIQWLKSTFGESHLAQIGRWHELRREQMIEELARWAGMTEDETRMAMEEKSRRRAPGAAQRLREEAESRNWKRWRNPGFLSDLATRMSPRPKALVPAAGRWTISAEPLEYVFPSLRLQGSTGRVTDIGEAAIDRLGGPRVEFVPHHLLNLLDRARAGAMGTGAGEDFQQLAMEDRATFELISRGDTLGIPPLESITVKSLLRKHRPVNILQLMKIKTDANKGRPSDKHKDLTDELPDMLLSVQLAYFKVHHSHAFYAAGLSSAAEIGEDLSILVREIRRRGIEVLPPDINLSGPLCTVFRGKIRLGLLMIRHLGEKALEEILSVRLGGGFNSLAEFCSGVSSRAVNLRVLQNLISAGAFDRFDQSRARMSSIITKLNRKHNNFTNEHGSHDGVQATLFDLSDMDQGPSREDHGLGEEPTWDFLTRVRREEEALGFNLMVDTMSKFPKTIEALRPIEADTVTHRYAGKLVKVIGLIDGVETDGPFIGDEVGAIIDVDGLAVSLNPRLAKVCGPVLRRGERAMALGEVNVTDGFTRVDALGVWRLRDLEEQSSKVARVRLCLRGENRTTLKHLIAVCKLYQGGTELELVDYPSGRGFTYRILARQRVFFCSPFFQGLCKILPMNQIELYAANGELLSIATAREKDSENS